MVQYGEGGHATVDGRHAARAKAAGKNPASNVENDWAGGFLDAPTRTLDTNRAIVDTSLRLMRQQQDLLIASTARMLRAWPQPPTPVMPFENLDGLVRLGSRMLEQMTAAAANGNTGLRAESAAES